MHIRELGKGYTNPNRAKSDKHTQEVIEYIRVNGDSKSIRGYKISSAHELKKYLIDQGYNPSNKIIAGFVASGRRQANKEKEPLAANGKIKIFKGDDDFYLGVEIND